MAKRIAMKGESTTLTSKDVGKISASKIVAATGVVARSGRPGLGKLMEEAMTKAILDAKAEGITDDAVIKERMTAAKEKAKADFAAAPKS